MPYICQIRTDIPAGLIQLLDLKPNTSQRSLIYDPPGQSKYARRPDADSITLTGAGPITTVNAGNGLAAYLLDRVEDTPNTRAMTQIEADTIAAALIARMDAGLALALVDINVVIAATVAGSGLATGASTGSVADVLEILSGAIYTLPAGSQVEGAVTFDATIRGSFTHVRHISTTGAFNISRNVGRIAGFIDATFDYDGTVGAALLLYADDGTLL